MSNTFEQTIAAAQQIEKRFRDTGECIEVGSTDFGLNDRVFSSMRYRRAHLCTVDARETKKLYLLHCTIMPHTNDNSPIYGFDIVCGPTKVSGAFHDFSEAGAKNHPMYEWFNAYTSELSWNRPRELPDWAKEIFSPSFVAIGAVGPEELASFITVGLQALDYYLTHVGNTQESGADFHMAQNRYCHYQKMNPRTPTSLQHLGFTEQQAIDFVKDSLFPEL